MKIYDEFEWEYLGKQLSDHSQIQDSVRTDIKLPHTNISEELVIGIARRDILNVFFDKVDEIERRTLT